MEKGHAHTGPCTHRTAHVCAYGHIHTRGPAHTHTHTRGRAHTLTCTRGSRGAVRAAHARQPSLRGPRTGRTYRFPHSLCGREDRVHVTSRANTTHPLTVLLLQGICPLGPESPPGPSDNSGYAEDPGDAALTLPSGTLLRPSHMPTGVPALGSQLNATGGALAGGWASLMGSLEGQSGESGPGAAPTSGCYKSPRNTACHLATHCCPLPC